MDIASGEEVFTLEGHRRTGSSTIAWSPDGESIATASFDGSARIFDARTGRQRFAILGTGGNVYSLDWSPDATRLVTGMSDGTARVWLVTEGGGREVVTLSAHDTRRASSGWRSPPTAAAS